MAGAVLTYNRPDLELLIQVVCTRDPAVVHCYISREQRKHHVWRVTLCAHDTFRHQIIQGLKGPTGLDESGV